MEISRSRLSSITEQSNEAEANLKTEVALMFVYHQLFALELVKPMAEPKDVFRNISKQIDDKSNSLLNIYEPFSEDKCIAKSQKQQKLIREHNQISQKQGRNKNYLSSSELTERLKTRIDSSNTSPSPKIQIPCQTHPLQATANKQLDETAESRLNLSDIIDRLNQFDERRTDIKFQIYTEQNNRMQGLYNLWANLHQQMKQTLQLFLGRVGNGKSLLELYNQVEGARDSGRIIEGISERHLLMKLDMYLQSLFSDERQILIYRNSTQKSRSNPSISSRGPRNVRKRLTYS